MMSEKKATKINYFNAILESIETSNLANIIADHVQKTASNVAVIVGFVINFSVFGMNGFAKTITFERTC